MSDPLVQFALQLAWPARPEIRPATPDAELRGADLVMAEAIRDFLRREADHGDH